MKKVSLVLALIIVITFACDKSKKDPVAETPVVTEDTEAPVITLTGKQADTIVVGSAYSDPGATANDNKDGDLTAFIVITGTIDANTVGNYTRDYIVRDAAGNSSIKHTRTVVVKNEVGFIDGTYQVNCNCQVKTVSGQTTETTSYLSEAVSSSTLNNSFTISKLQLGYTLYTFYVLNASDSSGTTKLSTSLLPFGSLSGVISPSKTSFTLNSTNQENKGTPPAIRNMTCQTVFTKQ